jgi:hypothetical protein
MNDSDLERLLGKEGSDPGCDDSGLLMDEYCDLIARGDAASDRFDEFLTHMRNCAACREDMEGLLAIVREQKNSGPR